MDDSAQSPETQTEAFEQPRDSKGHFIHVDKSVTPLAPEHHDPLVSFLHDETSIKKSSNDELIDIHIGNPLRKITTLLEEIKKQKAFSFNIKGSLGVAGIALVIGTFGIFGGTKALCSHGIQTKIGYVKTLKFQEKNNLTFWEKIPILSYLVPKNTEGRVILIEENGNAVRLAGNSQNTSVSPEIPVIATGEFDSCSSTITLEDGNNSLEPTK